jgi:hypothetical protein
VTKNRGAKDQYFGLKSQVSGRGDGYVINVDRGDQRDRRDTLSRISFVSGVAPSSDP